MAIVGGTGKSTFSLSGGALPPGLALNAATGAITGTPTTVGTFTFIITATDSAQASSQRIFTITINPAPIITPLAFADWTANQPGYGSATGLEDPDSGASSGAFNVVATGGTGAVTFSVSGGALAGGLGLDPTTGAVTGRPSAAGTFTFTASATDATGASAQLAFTLTINPAITLSPTILPSGRQNQAYTATINATGGTDDLDFEVSSGLLPPGLSLDPDNGAITGTPSVAGTFPFTVTVTDDVDATGQQAYTVLVTAPGAPPQAGSDAFSVSAGATLTVAAPGVLSNDGGGAAPLVPVLLSTTAHGTLTLNNDGSLTYVPAAGFTGTDTFSYQDKDAGSVLSNTVTDSITVAAAPTAAGDTFTVEGNSTLNVASPGVLANDPGGTAPLSAVLVTGTTHGILTLYPDGSLTYVPNSNFSGSDTFTYRAQDADSVLSAPVTDTITITPPPVAASESYTVQSGTTLNVTAPGVLANDSGGANPLSAVLVTTTANGELTLSPDGSLSYTPSAGFTGTDTFTYEDQDANGVLSLPVTDTITVNEVGSPGTELEFAL